MNFVKMHGLGNDYVYVNAFEEKVPDPVSLAVRISDRHRGVGSDGLILIAPSNVADVRMEMYNADGSRGKMCGNGIRCVAKFAVERGLVKDANCSAGDKPRKNIIARVMHESVVYLTVETDAGIRELAAVRGQSGKVEQVCVDMGEPILAASKVPVDVSRLPGNLKAAEPAVKVPLELPSGTFAMTCVSMGNPHAVFFVEDLGRIDLHKDGPFVERHPAFPDRVNAHFVQVLAGVVNSQGAEAASPSEVRMLTWERGSGPTQACGTGACAVAVAGVLEGRLARTVTAHLPGGDLELQWSEDGKVYMTGPAEEAFRGQW